MFEENKSWREFLEFELNEKKDYALEILKLEDYEKVIKEIEKIDKYKFNKKLMHGDFGLHNMLFFNKKLVGIIDPQPLIGDLVYDFIFCVFSNSKIAKIDIILNIYQLFDYEPKEKLDAMILFVLFCRIARCVKYKLKDLSYFVNLWKDLNI